MPRDRLVVPAGDMQTVALSGSPETLVSLLAGAAYRPGAYAVKLYGAGYWYYKDSAGAPTAAAMEPTAFGGESPMLEFGYSALPYIYVNGDAGATLAVLQVS